MAQAWVQDMSLSAPPQLRTVEGGPPANVPCVFSYAHDIFAPATFTLVTLITGSAVARHCSKAHTRQESTGKPKFDPRKIAIPENFSLSLCIRDYVGSVGLLPN